MAQIRAQQVISGARLGGKNPVTRETLSRVTLRSYNYEELLQALATSGLGPESTCATLCIVAGETENQLMGSFWRLVGPVWNQGHRVC